MTDTKAPPSGVEVFTFGEAVPVLDQRDLSTYFHSAWNGSWYEPPMDLRGLARVQAASPHLQSAIMLKVNLLAARFIPHPLLSRADFKRLALDYTVFGNGYLERVDNRLGRPLALRPTLALWTRVKRDDGFMMFVDGKEHDFAPGSILHIKEPDLFQEIYGVPAYTACLQSALLNESATLFRRKYYTNGSHAGFILYLTDTAQDGVDVDALREALKNSKGPGNFRNLFMYMPNGKPDGLKIIPIAEVMAKDEFLNIKTVSRDDVMASFRVPPQLLGMVPQSAGGFGDVDKASGVFEDNEMAPARAPFLEINDWLGAEVVRFSPYRSPAQG
jgi:PBSX family phage portal protein